MPNLDRFEARRNLEKSLRQIEQVREQRRLAIKRTDLPENMKRSALRELEMHFKSQLKQINNLLAQSDFTTAMTRASEMGRNLPPPSPQNRGVGPRPPSTKSPKIPGKILQKS